MGNLNLKRSKAKAARSSEGLDPEWQSVTVIILYWLKQIIGSAQIQKTYYTKCGSLGAILGDWLSQIARVIPVTER